VWARREPSTELGRFQGPRAAERQTGAVESFRVWPSQHERLARNQDRLKAAGLADVAVAILIQPEGALVRPPNADEGPRV